MAVLVTLITCYAFADLLPYRLVAFILLLVVSLIAVLFDILPVLLAALISAVAWNFFFIPPKFTLHIADIEDRILFFVYFLIALVNAVLTYKIKKAEKELNAREEKANAVKLYNTLLNSLSHELRTPIATIIGATDNLQNYAAKLSATDRFELVHEISKASLRLNQQVENLLNASRLESGILKLKKDWCDVEELLHDVVNRLDDQRGSRHISVQVHPQMPLFKIDKGMIEQVVNNIVYNAILYSAPHSSITISAVCYTDVLQLTFEDEGPGFPPEEINKVFDKFYRLNHSRPGGTGLGLSIVKGFIEAHHGVVKLENRAEGGARFVVQIPGETSYLNQLKNE